jgi:multidrug efflux pump
MIGVTLFGLFLTPVFYFVVRSLVRRRAPAATAADGPSRARGVATPVPLAASNGVRGT